LVARTCKERGTTLRQEIEKILPHVQKPVRYIGNEWNAIYKEWGKTRVKIAFAFPDVYEVGMSYLGLQILYHIVNNREDALMERTFAPWVDMEAKMREHSISLFTLESFRPLTDFDLVAFTLQYEMSYTNIINMLDLAGISLRASQRAEGEPFIMGGGPCAYNPEPLADFFDFFVIGEGEEVINEIIDTFIEGQEKNFSRAELLQQISRIEGVYVPSFYRIDYDARGWAVKITPREEGVPRVITKRIIRDLDGVSYPTKPIVPWMGVVHDRIMLEVARGCTRGCRFCQAGMLYRPVREKRPRTLLKQAEELVKNTGYGEISLTSLSSADYSQIKPVVKKLLDLHAGRGVGVSLPSLRVDAFSVVLAKEIQRVRRSSLTFAPEAGTQRLRDVINKGVTENDLQEAVSAAFGAGWTAVKLYFMIGLPTETYEDLDGIAGMARAVVEIGKRAGGPPQRLKVTVSASSFVPKAQSAFQWEPQDDLESLKDKQQYLKDKLKGRNLVFNWHDAELSFLEAVFARGDRRLGEVLEEAWRQGCRFDGWSEHFQYQRWMEAFRLTGLKPEEYAYRRFNYNDVLPWDHISTGVDKKFLIREHKRAMAGKTTLDCRNGNCSGCGLCPALNVEPDIGGE